MSSNKAITAVTPETFINNSVDSLNKVQSNILSSMNSNKITDVTKDVANSSVTSNDTFFYFIIIFLLLTILGVNLFLLLGDITDETIRNA